MKYFIEFNYLGDVTINADNKEEAMEKFFALSVGTLDGIADENFTLVEGEEEDE